ncbi:MAG: hypothetical protein LBB61_04315 [Treponema sp.]|jgi:clan AA aspartic protease|nr:hypothetical protein [Treponema sp.]
MGTFKEKIRPANAHDIGNAGEGVIRGAEIRSLTPDSLVDTGAWTLVINEGIRQKLGFAARETVQSGLADGSTAQYGLTEPVEIRWKDRRTSHEAAVLPDANDVLLGALPLEGMDLMVDPVNQRLAGVNGSRRIHTVY